MRIFLDANVIFLAIKSDGAICRLVQVLTESGHNLVADEYVVEEARRNIEAKYPSSINRTELILGSVHIASILTSRALPDHIELVDKDRPVLAAAIALGCDALVTGDSTHFGHLFGACVEGVSIHSPRSIAELLLTR